ncbi:MAG: hypothetical protein ACI9OJ_003019, partial [Myxococcota bacterium]
MAWQDLALVAVAALLVHGATLTQLLYTHDGWNDMLLGEEILAGEIVQHENILRIIPTLSFAVRAMFGPQMWAWHLPNLLFHALNAVLVLLLVRRVGGGRFAGWLSGILFAAAPLLAHPVEWVGGSYDLFATAGLLGASIAVIDGRLWRAVLFALLALLSKETGATVLGVAAMCSIAAGIGIRPRLKIFVVIGLLTVGVLGARAWQVSVTPEDALAGRSVEARPAAFLLNGPAGIGVAAAAPFTELVQLRDPAVAHPLGWVTLALFGVALAVRRRFVRQVLALLLAALAALLPVSLIAMNLPEMVENSRYLYASAAFAAPIWGLLIMGESAHRVGLGIGAVAAILALAGGVDRVLSSADVTDAAEPVADLVLALPPDSEVVVTTGFYDEPTARFLMSNWLRSQGIRARYVMRGTGHVFSRRPGVTHDASQAYFASEPRPFDPQTLGSKSVILLQDVSRQIATPTTFTSTPVGRWEDVSGTWTALAPPDSEDDPIEVTDGRVLHAERFLGPVATAEIAPDAAFDLPAGPLSAIELTVHVRSEARLRYATGYHERFLAVFLGEPEFSTALSAE